MSLGWPICAAMSWSNPGPCLRSSGLLPPSCYIATCVPSFPSRPKHRKRPSACCPRCLSACRLSSTGWRCFTCSRLRLRPSKLTQTDAKTTPCRVGRAFLGATAPQRMHPTLDKVFLCLAGAGSKHPSGKNPKTDDSTIDRSKTTFHFCSTIYFENTITCTVPRSSPVSGEWKVTSILASYGPESEDGGRFTSTVFSTRPFIISAGE